MNGADLYVTGWLQQAGGVPIGRVAKWDGDRWSAVGGSYPPVFDIAATGDQIYVGNYTIARWDGTGWSDIGGEVDGGIGAVAASGNDLYIGGNFTTVGGIAARGIAKWDGNAWSKIGDDLFNYVSEIVLSGEAILAGGVITATDGTELHCVAKWDGHATY